MNPLKRVLRRIRTFVRDTRTGRFVKREEAQKRPETTVTETVKRDAELALAAVAGAVVLWTIPVLRPVLVVGASLAGAMALRCVR